MFKCEIQFIYVVRLPISHFQYCRLYWRSIFLTGSLDTLDVTLPQVTEQNSKVVFDVTFYFYGGIISGWSVEPEKVSYKKYKNGLGSW